MPYKVMGKHNTSQRTLDFSLYDLAAGLNIKASPQELRDNELTIATNGYLRDDGAFTGRFGVFKRNATPFSGSPTLGLIRFYQTVVNGVPQSPFKVFALAQSAGTLFDVDRDVSYGGAGAIGNSGQAWQAVQVYDPNHTLSAPLAPTLGTATTGGSLVAGVYHVVTTYVNPLGETVVSPESTITIPAGTSTNTITIASPIAAGTATSYNAYVTAVGGASGTETKQGTATTLGTTKTITSVTAGAAVPASNTAIAPSDVLVICTGSGGPYIFDGTSVYTPPNWTTNIPGAKYLTLINGILWFGGVSGQPNLVFGSQLLDPENIPYYNEINVSRTVTGLGVIGAGAQAVVAVGMTQGLSLIVGTGPSNFDVVELPSEDGCVAYRSMITVDGILYYQGQVAMYRSDGYSIAPISNNVEPWILNDPLHSEYPMNGNRNLSWSGFWNHKIFFWYDSGNVGYANVALVWDLIKSGWTIYDGIPFMCGAPLNAPNDPDPPVYIVGNAITGQVYNFETAITTSGVDPTLWPTSDDGASIPVQVQSKYFKIGDPGTPKTLLRAYPEIFSTTANPSFGVATNYSTMTQYTPIPVVGIGSMVWGSSIWGEATWSSDGLVYTNQRIDYNLNAEAFAFSMISNDTNPPWRWAGLTGVFSQQGKA